MYFSLISTSKGGLSCLCRWCTRIMVCGLSHPPPPLSPWTSGDLYRLVSFYCSYLRTEKEPNTAHKCYYSLSLSLSLLTHLLTMKKSVKDDTDWLKRWLTVIHCVVVTQQQRTVHKAMTQNYWISLDQQLICFYPEYLPQCNVKSYRGSSICSWILTRSEFKWRYAFSILQMKNSVCARMKTAAHIAESHSSLCLSSSLSALNLAAFLPSRLLVLLAITLVSHYTEATAA